jgi:hypothetical protein
MPVAKVPWLALALVLAGCGSAPEKKVVEHAPPPVKDNRLLLTQLDQLSARIVPDHLLDKKVLPGGTIGEYQSEGRKYQLFIIETASPQDAAILLLDLKTTLLDPAYIAYMGGYFGTDSGKPVYVFAKKQYLAGVTGLAEDLADPVARQLAARL